MHTRIRHTVNRTLSYGLALAALAVTASGAARAGGVCDFVTRTEASELLGVPAGKMVSSKAGNDGPSCVIRAAKGGHDVLKLGVTTLTREEAQRLTPHLDEERGEEVPTRGDEAWYEVSVPDPKHPNDRRLVIHRDRTNLTLDLHSGHQRDAKKAFESVWHDISERLPYDSRR